MSNVSNRPRLATKVTKDALRQIRGGHPWVYDRSITSLGGEGRAGDLAVVFDDRRRFVAIGLYDPHGPVAIRILHHGKPETIDQAWLNQRLARARQRRGPLVDRADSDTNAYRLIHGENDGLGGLVIDVYDTTAVVKVYSLSWVPWLDSVLTALEATVAVERVVLRLSRQVAALSDRVDGSVLVGPAVNGPVHFVENGLWFAADVVRGHKTGHFLDQRDNRLLVRAHSAGRTVLDVFACTGGFALNAAAGGAREVTATDLSPHALESLTANASLNQLPVPVETVVGDGFTVLADLARRGRRFDLVIVDPPSFAQAAHQIPRALEAYRRLASLAAGVTADDGVVYLASCSSRVTTEGFTRVSDEGLLATGRRFRSLAETGHPIDHPVGFAHGDYLKGRLLAFS